MAQVFAPAGFVPGRYSKGIGHPLDDYVAHMDGVRNELRAHAQASARRAEADLAQRRGGEDRWGKTLQHARITVHREELDWYVNLVDPAALSIELGRAPAIFKDGSTNAGHAGLFILHDATGAHKRGGRRQRGRRKRPTPNYRRKGG